MTIVEQTTDGRRKADITNTTDAAATGTRVLRALGDAKEPLEPFRKISREEIKIPRDFYEVSPNYKR